MGIEGQDPGDEMDQAIGYYDPGQSRPCDGEGAAVSEAASEKTEVQPSTVAESGDLEAASEKLVANDRLVESLRGLLPKISEEERAERDRWRVAKGKKGRPRLVRDNYYPSMPIDKYHEELGILIGTQAKTNRGRQEAQYAGWAMRALFQHRETHPELLELTGFIDFGRNRNGDPHVAPGILSRKNVGVLAELGRLICKYDNGEEVAVAWAVELVGKRPRLNSKEAVAWLRQRRLQKTNLGNSEGVLGAITAAVDAYLASHPGTSRKAIEEALYGALWLYGPDAEDDNVN